MKCGEVYWAELFPRSGSEQSGRRPVIVVSDDGFNRAVDWRSVIVVPMTTSSKQGRRVRTVVQIPAAATSLGKNGLAVCHQITTLDRAKLTKRLGALSGELLSAVDRGLKATLDLD